MRLLYRRSEAKKEHFYSFRSTRWLALEMDAAEQTIDHVVFMLLEGQDGG